MGQIHYRISEPEEPTGKPPVLLLHMSPATSLVYENVMRVIGNSRVCVAPDTPGYGNSDSFTSPPSISDYADVMMDLSQGLGWTHFDVMGYHTGAMTAVDMASRAGTSVRKIVLVSAPIFTAEELVRFREIYSTEPIWTPDGRRLLELWQWFQGFFGVGTTNTVEAAGRIFYERLSGRENFWWGHNAAFNYDFVGSVSIVENPILVLNPNDDLVSITPRVEDLLRNGEVIDLPDYSHGFLDAHPYEVSDLVCAFLDKA